MSLEHTHPRRTAHWTCGHRITPPLGISKGHTFHSPKSPSEKNDPVLNVPSLPQRTYTSPEYLSAIVTGADSRMQSILDAIDKKFSGQIPDTPCRSDEEAAYPVPQFLIAHAASVPNDSCCLIGKEKLSHGGSSPAHNSHEHVSDSGLGTSVSGDSTDDLNPMRQCRFCDSSEPGHADLHEAQKAFKRSVYTPVPSPEQRHSDLCLSDHAVQKIKDLIVKPILAQEGLKEYHNLIQDIPARIGDRAITCLRDLEKTLIYLAPSKSKSAAAYLNFAETSIQCIHTTVEHLNDREQRRPSDRPYTNNYFLDLVQQVRQYARIMAVSRQKQREGKQMSKEDWTTGEKLRLKGGLTQNGEPAELVREKPNGESLTIDAGKRKLSDEGFNDDVESSMARKRKCDIGKIDWRQCKECGKWFKRPCDLTKHEKTHSRPWKCPEVGCKYHELGWPTEKERDRHINDKHNSQPVFYKCKFAGCSYTSKRESNCKQHMEKTHGYQYVRSKSRKGEHLTPVAAGEQEVQPSMPTPSSASAYQPLSTPSTTFNPSPITSSDNAFSPAGTVETGVSNSISPSTNMDLSGMGGNNPNDMFGDDATLFRDVDSYYTGGGEAMPNNGGLFNTTPPITDYSGDMGDLTMANNDPVINTDPGPLYDLTPPLTDFTGGRRTSDFSAIDDTIPNEAWTTDFDFGDDANTAMNWPAPTNFFPDYNEGQDVFFDGFGNNGESSAMAQTLFADDLVRGGGAGLHQ